MINRIFMRIVAACLLLWSISLLFDTQPLINALSRYEVRSTVLAVSLYALSMGVFAVCLCAVLIKRGADDDFRK